MQETTETWVRFLDWEGGGNGNLLLYSCLENPMDRGASWAPVPRVSKNRTWLKQLSMQRGQESLRSHNPDTCSLIHSFVHSRNIYQFWINSVGMLFTSPLPFLCIFTASDCKHQQPFSGFSLGAWAGNARSSLQPVMGGSWWISILASSVLRLGTSEA